MNLHDEESSSEFLDKIVVNYVLPKSNEMMPRYLILCIVQNFAKFYINFG